MPTDESHSAPPGPRPRPWYLSAGLALLAVALVLGGAWVYARVQSPFPFYGTAYTPPIPAPAFQGTDQDGQPWTFTPGASGRATAIFFGFTHCPNICPLTLAYIERVRQALSEEERQKLDVVLVSVDPERDTPERLKAYVEYFGKAQGIRIPEPTLSEVARAYGAGYQKVDIKGPNDYQVNHTTAIYLVDAGGKLRVLWDYTQLPAVERVKRDLTYVLENPLR